tara:strand:- start:2992 stop:3243 length:252 start_codon:yes stop_codon:yes gene_type:complete
MSPTSAAIHHGDTKAATEATEDMNSLMDFCFIVPSIFSARSVGLIFLVEVCHDYPFDPHGTNLGVHFKQGRVKESMEALKKHH